MSSSLRGSEGSRGVLDGVEIATEIAPHDVIVLELLEQTDFSNGSARDTFVLCFQPNLLEGDDFV